MKTLQQQDQFEKLKSMFNTYNGNQKRRTEKAILKRSSRAKGIRYKNDFGKVIRKILTAQRHRLWAVNSTFLMLCKIKSFSLITVT